MRLSSEEVQGIKNALSEIDNKAVVYLFGSRMDDNKKGGDIDLLIFSKKMGLSQKIDFKTKLWDILDEQKIDVVIADKHNKNFVDLVMDEAVLL